MNKVSGRIESDAPNVQSVPKEGSLRDILKRAAEDINKEGAVTGRFPPAKGHIEEVSKGKLPPLTPQAFDRITGKPEDRPTAIPTKSVGEQFAAGIVAQAEHAAKLLESAGDSLLTDTQQFAEQSKAYIDALLYEGKAQKAQADEYAQGLRIAAETEARRIREYFARLDKTMQDMETSMTVFYAEPSDKPSDTPSFP